MTQRHLPNNYDSQVSTEQNAQNDRDRLIRLLIANHVTYSQPMTCINQIHGHGTY